MNGAMVGFLVATGVVSAFIFALWQRMDRRRAGWGSSRRPIVSSNSDGGLSSTRDTWSFASWFSGSETFEPGQHGHSDSCSAWDSGGGGWDSGGAGGGGDCGGGGGGDGGGGSH